jgi:TorA maturation chaperone TorD
VSGLLPGELGEALAEDAEMLAALHDRELTAGTIAVLREVRFPSNLAMLPADEGARQAWRAMAAALPRQADTATLDRLAADYAAIYLTGAYGASPCESVWLDEDRLVCQAPMFALRELYAAAGLVATDWRKRPDDHLVLQLLYLAHALRSVEGADDLRRLAAMLDEHLLRWLPDFAARVAQRCEQPFFAGLARLTFVWCERLRDFLAERLGEPRPTREQIEERLKPSREPEPTPLAYLPGASPSW